jgi:hypothetical protein
LFACAAVQHKLTEAIIMKDTVKREPIATHARPSTFFSLLTGWVQQGVESFFATQRILMDVAMKQNATAMKALREGLSDPEHSPMAIMTELAVEGTSSFIEAQRILLNLAQKENDIVMSGIKERVGALPPAVAMTELLRRSVDTFVEMQQDFLTIASKQSQKMLEMGKGERPCLVEAARESMEKFVETQKKFLDLVAEETTHMMNGKNDAAAKKAKKTELVKLAHEAANAYIDAQKQLLDVAGQQMNVNLQAMDRAITGITPFRLPIANLTGEGVKSFVDAEKALIDQMMKRGTPKSAPKAAKHAKPRKHETARAVAATA